MAGTLAPIVAAVVIALPTWTGAVLTAIGTPEPSGSVHDAATPGAIAVAEANETAPILGPGASSPPELVGGDVTGDVTGDGFGPAATGPNGGSDWPSDGAPPTELPGPSPTATQPPPAEQPSPSAAPTELPTGPSPPPPPTAPPTPAPPPTSPPPTPAPPTDDDAPSVAFDVSVQGLTARFANRTKGAVSWAWSFGDGETATIRNPTHTYAAPGTYAVTLVATARGGASASLTETIRVGD
ncbi:MAG TPA: PKD domain-containing protein [Candidatus Limnocylindrales bacterium]|nr:PKD domain-containing protein [Candidatus Limnocylindrales bacterium]